MVAGNPIKQRNTILTAAVIFLLAGSGWAGIASAGHNTTPGEGQHFHITQLVIEDRDNNGYLDNVTLVFNATLDATIHDPADWTLESDWDTYTVNAITEISGTTLELHLAENIWPDTDATLSIQYTGTGLTANGGTLTFDDVYNGYDRIDSAAPVMIFAQATEGESLVYLAVSEPLDDDTFTPDNITLHDTLNTTTIPLTIYEPFWGGIYGIVEADGVTFTSSNLANYAVEITSALLGEDGNPAYATTMPLGVVPRLVLSANNLSLDEVGSNQSGTITVALNMQPGNDVRLNIYEDWQQEFTATPKAMVFGPGNWSTPQTITVTADHDQIFDGDSSTWLTIEHDTDQYALTGDVSMLLLPDEDIEIHITDNEPTNLLLSSTSLTLSENGNNGTVAVSLPTPPSESKTVVLDVTSANPSAVVASPATLTFNAANWNITQNITLVPTDNDVLHGSRNVNITVAANATATTQNQYDDANATIQTTLSDNDLPGLLITPTNGTITVSENGTNATMSVRLATMPDFGNNGKVVLNVAVSDTAQANVSATTLEFTSSTWNVATLLTVSAVNDDLTDGTKEVEISFSINTSATISLYDTMPVHKRTVTVLDDEAGLVASIESATIAENNGTTNYTVVLSRQPTANVTVQITSGNLLNATPTTITFGPGNWSTPQNVTLRGIDNTLLTGDRTTKVVHTLQSSDAAFNGKKLELAITVTDEDDDAVTPALVRLANEGINVTAERRGKYNVFKWTLPSNTPATPVGLQIWRANSPFTLAVTLNATTGAYEAKTYRDLAPKDSIYRVTIFYGESNHLGYAKNGTDAANIPGWNFLANTTVTQVDTAGASDGLTWWAWTLIVLAILIVLGAAILLPILLRRPYSHEEMPALEQDDYIMPPMEPEVREAYLQCPSCALRFHARGTRPMKVACPGCSARGVID